jgi:hypothetical protein
VHPPELRQRAKELRKQGLLIKVIAADIGVPKPTVARWLNTELEQRERRRAKRRKFSRGLHCPKCRRKMSNKAMLCDRCAHEKQTIDRYWNRERIIDAIQHWALQHGHAPTYDEWRHAGRSHPAVRTIIDSPYFERWSEALIAAGFEPRKRRATQRMTRQERAALRRKKREDALKQALTEENA